MEKLFDFYTRYDNESDKIKDLLTNDIICLDQNISILRLPLNITSTLLSKGIDKL